MGGPLRPSVRGAASKAGGQRREDGIEPLDDLGVAADHLTVTALLAPDTARGPDVDIANALRRERFGAADVVAVVGVAAVDDHVTGREERHELSDGGVDAGPPEP